MNAARTSGSAGFPSSALRWAPVGTDGLARFANSPLAPRFLQVLAEVTDPDAETAEETARELLDAIGTARRRPVLLHGEEGGAWPLLPLARLPGRATRIGLDDTLVLPDGQRAGSDIALVAALSAGAGP